MREKLHGHLDAGHLRLSVWALGFPQYFSYAAIASYLKRAGPVAHVLELDNDAPVEKARNCSKTNDCFGGPLPIHTDDRFFSRLSLSFSLSLSLFKCLSHFCLVYERLLCVLFATQWRRLRFFVQYMFIKPNLGVLFYLSKRPRSYERRHRRMSGMVQLSRLLCCLVL